MWNIKINKETVLFVAVMLAFTSTLTMGITFYTAYSTEDKMVIVAIDEYGEAQFEAIVMMPIIIVCALVSILISAKLQYDAMFKGEKL